MEDRNKGYASDSAHQMAEHIDEKLNNALDLINTYTFFIGKSLTEPEISDEMLKEIKDNLLFDALIFTNTDGINHISDGRTSDAAGRDYFVKGMQGKSGISVIYDSAFYDETMLCFYAPVRYNGEIIGVLRGAYLAEEYLKDMLSTTYFGEKASVHLCTPDGNILACSDVRAHEGKMIDLLLEMGMIDRDTAEKTRDVFENGGDGAFICAPGYKTDNICVRYLPKNEFVLVQTFPKSITENMVKIENLVGIRLESMLIGLFVIYIIVVLVNAGREKKLLEKENREMGYIIKGVDILFSRFAMADFEADSYQYLAGTKPEDEGLSISGNYQNLVDHICSCQIEESARLEYARLLEKNAVIEAMKDQDDLRFEGHVIHSGNMEWEHINIVCLERKEGRVVKVLFIRQNITEIKENELHIQAEISLAARKERQYRIAITSNSLCTFEFNLTKDLIEEEIIRNIDGESIALLEKLGLEIPCKASLYFEKWRQFIFEESIEEYKRIVNMDYLKNAYEQGIAEVNIDYWG